MRAIEFETTVNPDRTVLLPQAVGVLAGQAVRVIVLVEESVEDEERAWRQLTTQQFFQGYADSDAIYDDLPNR